jgi:hypothetical protein
MHCLSTGVGAAGTGGVNIIVDVLDHTGQILFTQNVVISNYVKFDSLVEQTACGVEELTLSNCRRQSHTEEKLLPNS